VSRLSHEPKVALRVLEDMMAPYINSHKIKVYYNYKPESANTHGDFVESVTIRHMRNEETVTLFGQYFIDATECGDVLPLANVEYVTGAESKRDTGEQHAFKQEDPLDMQSITYVFAVDYLEDGNHTIDEPEQYSFWKQFIPSFSNLPLLSWHAVNSADTSTL